MKLEHKSQPVVPISRFIVRLGRYVLLCMLLLSLSVLAGTAGYHYFGSIGWLDSFHMACMILTGMGPVAEMVSVGGKLFSSFYALYSGVAFLSFSAVILAPIIHRLLHILHVEAGRE